MKALGFLVALALLGGIAGCGTTGSIVNPQGTAYVVATKVNAGGAYKLLRGDGVACKVSAHNVSFPSVVFSLKGDDCVVEVAGEGE